MKVDLGTCAVCGAKNSKFVESCYKCGAALPWAPNYVAPKAPEPAAKPQSAPVPAPKPAPAPQNAPKPAPQPTGSPADVPKPAPEIKTVVSPPLDLESFGDDKAPLTDSMAERAQRRVPIPTWAIGAGVLGCIGLGMALMTAFGGRNSAPAAISPALTPLPTSAPVGTETPAPASAATPAASPVATTSALPIATTPAVPPTSAPVPTVAPTVAPTPVPVAVAGPAFDALFVNTSSGTSDQKNAYWKTVQNTKVSWRGDFVSLGNSPGGPLKIRCKNGANSAIVTVALITNPPQNLPPMQANQSITVEGLLSSYSVAGYDLTQGRVN